MEFYTIVKKPKGDEQVERYRTDYEYDDSVAKGEAPKCPSCQAFVGMLQAKPPFRVHLETWGEDYGDLAFWMTDVLGSARFRDEYEHSGLRGLSNFEPVVCVSRKHFGAKLGDPPTYFSARPRLGGARVDPIASGIEWGDGKQPTCDLCLAGAGILRRWKGVVIDQSSWKGDDIFYPYGIPGVLVVSARFYEWALDKKFRNLAFERAGESAHDFYPWESVKK